MYFYSMLIISTNNILIVFHRCGIFSYLSKALFLVLLHSFSVSSGLFLFFSLPSAFSWSISFKCLVKLGYLFTLRVKNGWTVLALFPFFWKSSKRSNKNGKFWKIHFNKISRQTQKYFKRKPKIDDFALKPPKAK